MVTGTAHPPDNSVDQVRASGIVGEHQTLNATESSIEKQSPNDLFVVIPAYNEATTIRDVVERTLRHAKNVILVDDGSQDGTGEFVKDLSITVLRQDRNSGKASALVLGFGRALEQGAKGVIT